MCLEMTPQGCGRARLAVLNVRRPSATYRESPLSDSCLAVIPESHELDADDDYDDADDFPDPTLGQDSEVKALKAALEECWTLCNTLANLSSIHRERVFNSSGTPDAHEKAWKSCWKLCKRLYHSRDDISESYGVRTNLDLCRDFCQSLFDVRQKKDETADSILRVSFELNNQYELPILSTRPAFSNRIPQSLQRPGQPITPRSL